MERLLRRLSSIPPEDRAPQSRARLQHLTQEIGNLRRPTEDSDEPAPSTLPTGGWPRVASTLAEMAVHHLVLRDLASARAAAGEALQSLDILTAPDRAEVSLILGDVFLALSEAHRARERFEEAVRVFDAIRDLRAAARARIGLSRALLMQGDPAARPLLEDAGTLFEDLGDEEAVRSVEIEIREVEASFEESPRSFHGLRRR